MSSSISIHDVFVTNGQPTTTYVVRQDPSLEDTLNDALKYRGNVCLVTGPSKTGKTTLYTKVLKDCNRDAVKIQCNKDINSKEFWSQALEKLDFKRIETTIHRNNISKKIGGSVEGKIGWLWLANIIGAVSLGISRDSSEEEAYRRILAKPCPSHIIPALKELPIILVVEDFHYLQKEVQKTILQQWKEFIDNNISVIVVGTTHRAVELAEANKDLLGRICQIDLGLWSKNDLKKIIAQGFGFLEVNLGDKIAEIIAEESVGLPIITQDACLHLFLNKSIESIQPGQNNNIYFDRNDAYKALHTVAKRNYIQLERIYDRLTNPQINSQYHEQYGLVLACFTLDPLTSELSRSNLDERLNCIKKNVNINLTSPITSDSINEFLEGLDDHQRSTGLERLLDWSKKDQTLYIIEPSFLFYLRSRKLREAPPGIVDKLREIFIHSAI